MENKKLKPAKQALADAIHKNGGWPNGCYKFATSNAHSEVCCSVMPPSKSGCLWVNGLAYIHIATLDRAIKNWHQCILSREEYLTAYPVQVKTEVETERNAEVETKSESEMAIKASDWHKNGELPPVGVGVQLWHGGAYAYDCEVIAKRGNSYVLWNLTWDRADSADCSMCDFSPLRTEREKAIDEMQRIIESSDKYSVRERLGAIYDAGMYKVVK